MIIENQAFSPSYDLAPPSPSPSSPVSKLDQRHTGRLRKRDLLMGEGERGRRGAKSYDGEKAWSSKNSILTALSALEVPAKRSIDPEATHQWEPRSLDKILLSWTTAGHRYATANR
jgi:hypothetical protein